MKQLFAIILTLSVAAASASAARADEHDRGLHRGNGAAQVTPNSPLTGNRGRHLGQLRRLQAGSLSDSQVQYALTHQSVEMARLRSMRSIDYSRVRIVHVSSSMKARLHISQLDGTMLAYSPDGPQLDAPYRVAQVFGSNNGVLQQLQGIIGGLIVQNAISNTLGGGGSSGSAGATLAQVLLNNGIPLSNLLGVFLGGNGILNALVG